MREQEEPISLLHKNEFVRGLLLRGALSRQTSTRRYHRVANTARQPHYTSAEPRPTLIDLSSSVPTTTILAPISSGPIKNLTSTPSH